MTIGQDVVLVTSATGKIGTELVHQLASHASRPLVRVATRSVSSDAARLLHALNPATVQPVAFDVARPELLAAACAGVTKVCLIAPFSEDMAGWHQQVVEALRTAGSCGYIVKVSVTGARSPESDPPPGRIPLAHWRGEEAVRASGIPATMIRPTIFMQHFLTVPSLYRRGADRFYLPTGDGPVAFLDCRDIATLAAALVTASPELRQPYEQQAYELTGPSAVTAQEIAAMLSWVSGRRVAHVDGEAAFVERSRELGSSDAVKYIYAEAAEGWFAKVEHAAFTDLTGRRTTSFAKFAHDHAAYFQPE